MAVRKVVTAKQMKAAQLLVDGESAFRALTAAGYSHWTSRNFGALLRDSWGLREAIRQEQENRRQYLTAKPARRRRYDRRPVARAVQNYCLPEDRETMSNTWLHNLKREEQRAQCITAGNPPKRENRAPVRCSLCKGLTEGNDHWCPNCLRIERM